MVPSQPGLELQLARGVKGRAGRIDLAGGSACPRRRIGSRRRGHRDERQGRSGALDTLFEGIAAPASVRSRARERVVGSANIDKQHASFDLPRYRVVPRAPSTRSGQIPVRLSFADDGRFIRAAAIHEAATVPERLVRVDRSLIDELVERTTDPPADKVDDLCNLLGRLLVPAEFRPVLRRGPSFVLDVDRSTARVHLGASRRRRQRRGGRAALRQAPSRTAASHDLQPGAASAGATRRNTSRVGDRRSR